MRQIALTTFLILVAGTLTGCGGGAAGSDRTSVQGGSGVLGRMHPKASAETVEEVKAEEARVLAARMAMNQQTSMNGVGRVLPPVSTDPIAPPAEAIASQGPVVNNPVSSPSMDSGPVVSEPGKVDPAIMAPAKDGAPVESPPVLQPEAASYSTHYVSTATPPPPPGAVAGGQLVPPPPAVTLSTNANVAYGGAPDNSQYANPYANPYLNPYAIPYQQYPQYQMPPQAMPPQQPQEQQRPQGLFGSGRKRSNMEDGEGGDDAEESKPEKKEVEFVPIRPTGMEARSPYKQKDDLKVLWTGALNTYQMQKLMEKDKDLQFVMKKVDVGLPPDATKGMFTVAPRRVASVFRPIASEKRSIEQVRKIQFDLVQGYYRYLYAYNKYAIQQQTVQARKQEIEVAQSRAERQRAEADLARAQDLAQSSTEDMRAAQEELAAVAGAQSARTIIGRISGITPSIQALAQAEKSAEPIEVESNNGGVFGSVGNFFFHNRGNEKPVEKADKEPVVKEKGDKKKDKKDKKDKRIADESEDLTPSKSVATKPPKRESAPVETPRASQSGPISFELKDIEITARKSILTVAIHNTGSETFKFSPDVISISEGDKKIAEASMRAEFDSTSVKPNGEVQGKITIFGRPWNDRLSVNLSDGSNNIQLKRHN